MKTKLIISTALAAATLTGIALAGTKPQVQTVAPVAPVEPIQAPAAQKAFSADFSVGYSTNYDFRGLILRTSDGENMTPIKLDTRTRLTDKLDLTAGLSYKALWNRDVLQDNEFNFNLGLDAKCVDGLTSRIGYDLYQGGFPGLVSKVWEGNHSTSHEVMVGFQYDFDPVGIKGLFMGANAHYAFSGVTGWWFDVTVGYKKQITEKLAGIISATWWSTSSYFDAKMPWAANGSQSYSLNLQLPYQVCKNVTFTPFVSGVWLGNGSMSKGYGYYGSSIYRNFTLVAGAGLTYSF